MLKFVILNIIKKLFYIKGMKFGLNSKPAIVFTMTIFLYDSREMRSFSYKRFAFAVKINLVEIFLFLFFQIENEILMKFI